MYDATHSQYLVSWCYWAVNFRNDVFVFYLFYRAGQGFSLSIDVDKTGLRLDTKGLCLCPD